jgi:Xaa-Pro aminopeptidase
LYTERISRLASSLQPDTVWIAEPGTSSEYFVGGFSSRDWWLSERPLLVVVSPSHRNITILTARFEQARAELVGLPPEIKDVTTFVPWLESESPYDILADHFGAFQKVILDGQVRSFVGEGLQRAGFTSGSVEESEIVKELRERKDEREIGLLRCANQVGPRHVFRPELTGR